MDRNPSKAGLGAFSLTKDQERTPINPDSNFVSVVAQHYDTDVNKEYIIRGNSAILKCQIPSFVADFVSVVSWHTDQEENFYPDSKYGARSSFSSFEDLLVLSILIPSHGSSPASLSRHFSSLV